MFLKFNIPSLVSLCGNLWKVMYDQTRVWFVCNHAVQIHVTQWHNVSTVNMNCLVKQTNAYTEIYFIPKPSMQQHHLLCTNGAAKSSDSLAIKIPPRRINCNSLFIAYYLSTCLWEHQIGKFDIQRTGQASWYILIMKANKMHYFSNLLDKVLYMFRTGPLFIIRSVSTLYMQ